NGTFGAGTRFQVGKDPLEIAIADFDGDGDLDLATVNVTSRNLSVLLGDGRGAFGAPVDHPLGRSPPTALKTADFDGDGVPDLAAGTETSIRVLLGRGDGSFPEPVAYFSAGLALTVGDVDSDGDPDLIAGTEPNDVTVRLNDGRGGFGRAVAFPVGELPTILAAGDFDGDGALDLAMKGNVSVLSFLWNGDAETLALTTEIVGPLAGCARENGCRPHSGTTEDIDGDGDLDIIGANTHPGSFSILKNDGAGNMTVLPAITFGGEHPQSVATGDVDGDGDADAVTVDNLQHDLWVHLNEDGRGRLELAGRFPVGLAPINVKLADLDGDGDLDAVSANQESLSVSALFNDGRGRFSAPRGQRDYRVLAGPKAVETVDLDGDGDIDIAVANSNAVFVSILLGEGDGTFAPAVHYRLSSSASHVASGDFDRDGDLDLVVANSVRDGVVSILPGEGDGTFARAREYLVGRSLYSVATLDVNGDGVLDLATANEGSSSVSILRGAGDGSFEEPLHLSAGRDVGLRFVLPGDIDGDGDTDLVSTNRGGRSFTVFHNQASVEVGDYLESVCTPLDFHQLSAKASPTSAADRFTKFTLPASPQAGLSRTLYQNTKLFPLHEEFLETVFPDFFPALDPQVYESLVGRRATRQYFVGSISRIPAAGRRIYGFSIFARFDDPVERLTAGEVKSVHDRLRETFRLEPLAYFPNTRAAVDDAEGWDDPGFEIYFDTGSPSAANYEPYTRTTGYGRVRILSEDEFEDANETGGLSFQDVLVLERAPRDIEGVVGGVITAEPQGELSHVAVRTSRRGTPNAFVRNALQVFRPHEGQLVRLAVGDVTYVLEPATEAQARAFWERNRPELSTEPAFDRDFDELSSLEEIAAMDRSGAGVVEARFGGKAANLARLQSILDGEWSRYRLEGFGIPVRHYFEFMESNSLASAI
ncbi:MAG: VCBS repeat-containing protein, partial [Actinobacteria bacterium]|nr:VCBS repeat-containing protein [Actinomycetota bacterium]